MFIAPHLILLAAIVEPLHLSAQRVPSAPVIDGHLRDAEWGTAAPSDGFTQYVPSDGASPSERTVVRAVYDDEALYIAVYCEQRFSPIIGYLTRRDSDSESDSVSIFLDTRGQGKDAFWVAVNVAGTQADGTVHDQNVMSGEWDETWEARTTVAAHSWSAEFKIPFRALRFTPALAVQNWGLQVVRYIAARQEADQWSHVPRDNVNWVANYGRLDNLRDLVGASLMELRPFTTLRVEHLDPGDNVLVDGYRWRSALGLDLKLHITESLTLDSAIAPDFTQVEADQVVLNLSNYEVFLPEKRPIFVEGADLFSTPMQEPLLFGAITGFPNRIFYSRRIGSAPGAPSLRDDANVSEVILDRLSPSTIYVAGKFTGTIGRLSIAALSAITEPNKVMVEDVLSGTRSSRVVDPLTVSSALRLKRNLGERSQVGLIATAVNRLNDGVVHPTVGPATLLCPSGITVSDRGECFRSAYVGAVDGLWRSPSGEYLLAAQLTGSLIQKGVPTTSLDGTVVRSGDHGTGGWVRAAREGGKHLLLLAEYTGADRTLDYNDAGYMGRANLHEIHAVVAYRTLDPGIRLLDTYSALSILNRWNFNGLDIGKTYEATTRLRFRNFWTSMLTVAAAPRRFDDREIGDGVALQRPSWLSAQLDIITDPRRSLVLDVKAQALRHEMGFGGMVQVGLLAHALRYLDLQLTSQVTSTSGELRFAPRASVDEYVFGRLQASSVSATLRGALTFNPRLSLQAYSQIFLAAGRYSDFLRLDHGIPPGTPLRRDQLLDVSDQPTNSDFEQGALNANVVLRWEYHLGSTLYLVYSRAQIPITFLEPGQAATLRLSALPQSPAVDVILLKASFWWTI